MLTEQMNALPGLVDALNSEHDSTFVHAMEEFIDLAPILAATVIEQQAEIERLREALRNAWVHMHAAGTAVRMMPKDTIWPADFIRATERTKQALETQ